MKALTLRNLSDKIISALRKLNASKVVEESEAIRGMIFTIKHLVKVEEL